MVGNGHRDRGRERAYTHQNDKQAANFMRRSEKNIFISLVNFFCLVQNETVINDKEKKRKTVLHEKKWIKNRALFSDEMCIDMR